MYLVDSNVLIEAKNRYYAFDIVPAFWDWLVGCHLDNKVFTVRKVIDEVIGAGDELSQWVRGCPPSFAIEITSDDQPHMARLSEWAVSKHYTHGAVTEFLQAADYFLVAQAARLGYTVVTHERPDPQSRRKVKIPDACIALGVAYVTTFEMMRAEGVRFTL